MALELHLLKEDSTPWGFRLTGGADFRQPMTVVKVSQGSVADESGLQVGDVLVRVNDTPTAGLTHTETHDLISASGNKLILAVRRDEFEDVVERELGTNLLDNDVISSEISDILKELGEDVEDGALQRNDVNNAGFTPVEITIEDPPQAEDSTIVKKETTGEPKVEEAFKEPTKQVVTIPPSPPSPQQQKKWSTFLQKPKRPKPKPKMVSEEEPKVEPYRVIIKKQKKKKSEEEETKVEALVDIVEETETAEDELEAQQEEPDVELQEEREESVSRATSVEEKESLYEEREESVSRATTVEEEREVSETSLSLEEQLAQVQKQLQALSQLPSAIQSTLDAVTQQLTAIVSAKAQKRNIEEEKTIRESYTASENEITEPISDDEEPETLTEELIMKNEEETVVEKETSDVETEAVAEETEPVEEAPPQEPTPQTTPTEEERESKRKEAKKLKVDHWNNIWPWSDKTKPIYRESNCCMTPSKVTATKKINFLKYQPPPKNLDYLQRSEVYRLVHDMEPPVKGIARRASRILAEQDYYEQKEEPKMEP